MLPPISPFEDVTMICLIGRGSFGRVYKARWDISMVALKVVEHEGKEESAMAFEGALSTSLAHPNLVQTFKFSIRDCKTRPPTSDDESAFEVWIVQEWCNMGSLAQKLSRTCAAGVLLPGGFQEISEVAAEISSAALYLHGRGIIHGDLSATNVVLTERSCRKGYVTKVSDFGLARVLDKGASKIQTSTIGTVSYMPPELFTLEGSCMTKKVDVYAFGVILWQLCSGSKPFEGLQPAQVVVMVSKGAQLVMPHTVPSHFTEMFEQCCARDPSLRPGFETVVPTFVRLALPETVASRPPLRTSRTGRGSSKLLLEEMGERSSSAESSAKRLFLEPDKDCSRSQDS